MEDYLTQNGIWPPQNGRRAHPNWKITLPKMEDTIPKIEDQPSEHRSHPQPNVWQLKTLQASVVKSCNQIQCGWGPKQTVFIGEFLIWIWIWSYFDLIWIWILFLISNLNRLWRCCFKIKNTRILIIKNDCRLFPFSVDVKIALYDYVVTNNCTPHLARKCPSLVHFGPLHK